MIVVYYRMIYYKWKIGLIHGRWFVNIDKCEVLQISLRNSTPVNYYLYNNPLRIADEAKYLGVLLDSKLNFNKHRNYL